MVYYTIAAVLAVFALVEVVIANNAHECKVHDLLKERKTLLSEIYQDIKGNKILVGKTRTITLTASIILILFLSVMSFVRFETGYDYTAYAMIYDNVATKTSCYPHTIHGTLY